MGVLRSVGRYIDLMRVRGSVTLRALAYLLRLPHGLKAAITERLHRNPAESNGRAMWALIFGGQFIRSIDDQNIERRFGRVQTKTKLLLQRADQSQS